MADSVLDFRNTNSVWSSVIVETLVRCGLTHAVISPGSRSTPLTVALATHPAITATPILDERSASFFALGLAKQQRRPVLLLCTSGSAGAHYFPAIIEAHESRVPLIVITADRPPEMRECASGQTIDQLKMFGAQVNWFHEYAVPEANFAMLRYARQTTAHAFERAMLPSPGPVQLNAPFRDPLAPISNESAKPLRDSLDESFFSHLGTGKSFSSADAASQTNAAASAPLVERTNLTTGAGGTLWQKATTARGVIVAGPDDPADRAEYARIVLKLSVDLGWPILADALSPLRHYASEAERENVVAAYDAILRSEKMARALSPKNVICLGGWPTSKVLRSWLESSGAEVLLVSPHVANRDALHGRTRQILARPEQLAVQGRRLADDSFRTLWSRAESAAQKVLREKTNLEELVEPRITSELASVLSDKTPLYVASSMPIRDVEYFWPANDRRVKFFFNRGANGIDGTLSTALGVAHGSDDAFLLTGDLAFLHDTNGLLVAKSFRGRLTIVLVNNNGGGIFQHLPIAQFEPPFEKFFATPQDVDFSKLCSAYRVEHLVVENWIQFRELIFGAGVRTHGVRVLEVRTERGRDVALRKTIFAEAARAVDALL